MSSRPHKFPMPPPDAEIIAWRCRACGEWVSEFGSAAATKCSVNWRGRWFRLRAALTGGES